MRLPHTQSIRQCSWILDGLVQTGVLLHTLRDSKVLGKIGVWIGKFLDSSRRQQAVAVEGRLSSLSPVISGVPQGTVLGPILFLLHISGIAKEVSAQSTVSSYVDDTRVTRPISNPSLDCQAMQQDLQAIYKWAEQVNMVFIDHDSFVRKVLSDPMYPMYKI